MVKTTIKKYLLTIIGGGIVISALLLCSCIPVKNPPLTPVTLPSQFSGSGNGAMSTLWWNDFDDPALSGLIDRAISDNFNLLIARDRLIEAQAVARQAGAFLTPSLDLKGTGTTSRNHTREATSNHLLLGLAASYELDLWGRLDSLRKSAEFSAKASGEDYHTAVISLTAEVARNWYQLVTTDLQLQLLNKQRKTNKIVLKLISMRFRAGQAGRADVLQQRQLVETNTGDIAALEAVKSVLKHQLTILIGKTPGTASLPQATHLITLPPLPRTGVPIDLLKTRPDVRSSYFTLQATDYRVAAAIANRLPRLTISADISTTGEHAGDLFNNWISSLAANLFGPLIDGGRRRAEVDKTKAVARQQFNRYAQTVLEAIGEVENSLIQEKKQREILSSQQIRLQLAADSIKYITHRYRQGGEDYQRVLMALLSHQGLQRTILNSKLQLINYRIALYRALSGHIPSQIKKTSPPPASENAQLRQTGIQ